MQAGDLVKFAVRRLYYAGSLSQRHLREGFSLEPKAANLRMRRLKVLLADYLAPGADRKLFCGYPDELRKDFPCISGNQILNEVRLGGMASLQDSGFPVSDAASDLNHRSGNFGFMAEVFSGPLNASAVPDDVDFTALLWALCRKTGVEIQYVKLAVDSKTTTRIIYPMFLRLLGDHITVSAYDFDALVNYSEHDHPPPLKTFSLFRMLSVCPVPETQEYSKATRLLFRFPYGREIVYPYKVTLNPQYSEDQRTAISRELGLDRCSRKFMDEATLFFFKVRFCSPDMAAPQPSGTLIWPPVVKVELI